MTVSSCMGWLTTKNYRKQVPTFTGNYQKQPKTDNSEDRHCDPGVPTFNNPLSEMTELAIMSRSARWPETLQCPNGDNGEEKINLDNKIIERPIEWPWNSSLLSEFFGAIFWVFTNAPEISGPFSCSWRTRTKKVHSVLL